MALTPQSFIQIICDYIPCLRGPYAQRIFGEQKLFGISEVWKKIKIIPVRRICFQEPG